MTCKILAEKAKIPMSRKTEKTGGRILQFSTFFSWFSRFMKKNVTVHIRISNSPKPLPFFALMVCQCSTFLRTAVVTQDRASARWGCRVWEFGGWVGCVQLPVLENWNMTNLYISKQNGRFWPDEHIFFALRTEPQRRNRLLLRHCLHVDCGVK